MILRVEDLETYIGEFHILQGVSLEVPEGKVTVVLGRNGAGKTTTLRSIMGLLKPRKGRIEFKGERIDGLPAHMVARKGIGYVPEDQAIFSGLTVEENLKIAMKGNRSGELLDKVLSIFPDLKVAWQKKAGSLSGGQRQMLALGRALVGENSLLLIDEPSKGLAPVVVEKVAEAIKEIKRQTTVVLVEQNFNLAQYVGDRFYIIDDGRTVAQGEMEDLVNNVNLQQKYLGISL
ncbi:amino acid/amide ABC transporter ATP-binding protein 2, HAAT family [Thermanaeromonas toyohensis ToBE]|uniref:Amino acid/amide ABC transporter ATP-binding protein 2, HAAT family n=1 Tax=Thermanaeromonas toyohensis ToBE TaxID=698762 RepID=A0A1W1W0Q5_9FIRM|nr:ABC transporter ATP-binding protein [Thermanaeromonas toyohensis]SMB99178.1 amino acid/amide ABC transporter ATP-binding protein 2, HAAT family [Thermanaeromonas toyohensis ToBE]